MADDEKKTLLKIDGDAEGAKRAARETRKAVSDVGEATGASAQKTQDATTRTSEALDKQTKETQDGARGFDDLARGMGTSEQQANAAREALSRLSPELGALMEMGVKGQDVFAFLFSPLGAGAAAAGAVIAGVTLALKQMREEAERANAEFERTLELDRERSGRTRETTEEVADVLARAGIVSEEAIGKARGIERQLERRGFREEAIRAVLPYAVSEEGELALSMEEIERLTAREEFAPGGLAFEDPREMPRRLRQQQRRIERQADLVTKQRQAVTARVERENQAIAAQDRDVIAKRLAETEAIPEDQLERVIDDMLDVANKGRISAKLVASSAEDRLEFERRQREAAQRARRMGLIGPERMRELSEMTLFQAATQSYAEMDWAEEHPILARVPSFRAAAELSSWILRRLPSVRRREGRRGRGARRAEVPEAPEPALEELPEVVLIRPKAATFGADPATFGVSRPGFRFPREKAEPGTPRPERTTESEPPAERPTPPPPEESFPPVVGIETEDEAMLSAGGIGEPGTTVIFNHGNIHMGRDSRLRRVRRIENP